jgi:predicted RNA binding protein YcfA (HicA-like mRNA interferase family)
MGKRDKLIELICTRRPPEARFSDVKQLLEIEGYVQLRQKGSHVAFGKEGSRPFIVSKSDGKVKRTYLDEICTLLNLYEE